MMSEIKNAKIDSTMLGYEGHNILTCMLYLSYGSSSAQAFGGYNLTTPSELKKWVQKILEVVGVENWEDLPGKHIRVESDSGRIYKIGNLLEDKWFTAGE
jgi:hypothetical protein